MNRQIDEKNIKNPRYAAVLSLNSSFKSGKFVNLELDSTIKKYGFEDKDKAFYTRLLYGTVEKKITLDYMISLLSDVKEEKIQPMVKCILETGLYQIFYMDRVPDSAACNEATELVKVLCPKAYAGYVNAVMRSAVRKKAELAEKIAKLDGIFGVSVRHSIPEWICGLWESDYGNAEKIARGFEVIPPHLTLRVNTLKISAAELFEKMPSEYGARLIGNELVTLSKSVPVSEIYGFDDGLFFVQDESSAVCASLISPKSVKAENPVIIDTCACPGGKTFSMAISFGNKGTVYSMDLHKNRLSLIEKGAERLGISSVDARANDARTPLPELFGKADAVLCDVPCSGLGIIAKKPDIRYKSRDEILRLPEIQKEILSRSAEYVKPGGILVYSTCTLRRAENEENIEYFLSRNPDFALAGGVFGGAGMKTFFPHIDGTDGFFAAKLERRR